MVQHSQAALHLQQSTMLHVHMLKLAIAAFTVTDTVANTWLVQQCKLYNIWHCALTLSTLAAV